MLSKIKLFTDTILFFLRFRWIKGDDLTSFFYRALLSQDKRSKKGLFISPGNYYEFGVGWGGTLLKYIKALKTYCSLKQKSLDSFHIFGFDSFEGLPEKKSPKDDLKRWHKGLFSNDLSIIEKKVKSRGINLNRGSIRFFKGYFEETLTSQLRTELSKYPPSIVNIDCDYYSSTITVLRWLRPILQSGTLFYFDDIWSFCGHPDYGEIAAIREFNEEENGLLTPYPGIGLNSQVYIFSRKNFEYTNEPVNNKED
ncbi:MAG: TylF/MycF/NovP-related O-methyltransferase [Candidatus Lokiarchaeia archaeon]